MVEAGTDGGTWGPILGGLGLIGGGAMWAWERFMRNRVTAANGEAQIAAAAAQETIYTMLTNRLETLEKEMQGVRKELSDERAHSRRLEIHIFKLEALMRQAGITPPVFEE